MSAGKMENFDENLGTIIVLYLVTVINSGSDLAEDSSSLRLVKNFALTEVIVEFAAGRVLHHQDHLLLVLKHFVDVNDVGMTH